jgi:hypothetical protein
MKWTFKMHGLTLEEMQGAAEDIYIYPLIPMDLTRRIHATDNHVRHPHLEYLNSSAWIDLGREPIALSVPSTPEYYLLSRTN